MVNKCSVGGYCKTNYVGHDTHAVFSFPKDPESLRPLEKVL